MKECLKCQHCFDDSANFCPHDNTPLVTTIYGNVIINGRYLLEKRLGKGGMGIVFRAKHKYLKSLHAIKVILPSLVQEDGNLLVRFKQEAVLAASINHPNVIRVTDFGVEDERMPYLVMEFVDGTPLSLFLGDEKGLPTEKVYLFFQPIALAVAEAHRKGIVHRDLKPQNIMVEKDLPLHKAIKVLDFGLAKIKSVESFGSLVQANTMSVLGSPPYMAPEQWENEGIDHRTDIYSLGVILFQMLTGRLPFDGDSIPSVMYQHLTAPPPTFASLGASLSPEIEAVVQRSLQKKQEERYDSVEEMLADFERSLDGSTIAVNIGGYDVPASKEKIQRSKNLSEAKIGNLSESQRERLLTYFDASEKAVGILADEQLAQEFLQAQDRAEEAKVKADQADRLVNEFAEAQKLAEQAQQKALEARQKIEADVRRRVEAEMEGKLAEQQALQKAEAERLAQEAEARKKAEERANYLAQAALEAQKQAEAERKKSEQASHQRELEESERRKAEIAAAQLAEQVAEAKRKFEEARKQAEAEAELRRNAELKRQKIEAELQAAAEAEVERRARAEAEARKQIEEQAQRFEQEAFEAQRRVEEARRLAEMESQKREEAELARQHAEEEARRLAQEIIEVQKRMEEIRMHTSSSTSDKTLNLLDYQSSGQVSSSDMPADRSAHLSSAGETSSKDTGSQTGDFANQTVPIVHYEDQTSTTQDSELDGPRVTVESRTAASSNPSFSGFLTGGQPLPRKITIPVIAGGAFAVFLTFLVGGFALYSFLAPEPQPEEETKPVVQNPGTTSKPEAAPVKTEMILIEGGSFMMGRSDVGREDRFYGDQYPAHMENVQSFYISKTETTNAEYAEFVKETNHPAPKNWDDGKVPKGQERIPVTNVSLADANAYAEWFTKKNNQAYKLCRLPTETEWEYVARNGAQQTDFPWGNEWKPDFANVDKGKLAEVGAYPEATLAGVKDMLGNVNEWTSSKYALYKGNNAEKPAAEKEGRMVTRGSSWDTSNVLLKKPEWLVTFRYRTPAEEKAAYLGFRLVCEK